MSQSAKTDPLKLLQQMEQRSRRTEPPRSPRERPVLSAIGFRMGEQRLMVALDDLDEVYDYSRQPKPSPVPGARPWLHGMASRRGRLLPVVDLAAFLLDQPATVGRATRVLVLKHPTLVAGLLVAHVVGLRHFAAAQRADQGPPFGGRIPGYLKEVYRQDGEYWGRISVARLARDPAFQEVAG